MTTRAVIVPRERERVAICGFQCDGYRCVMEINRVVESWNPCRGVWQPEIRLCHLHAIEYLTGDPVYVPSIGQQIQIMLDLGA